MIVPHGGGRAPRRRGRVAALVVERGSVTIDSLAEAGAAARHGVEVVGTPF